MPLTARATDTALANRERLKVVFFILCPLKGLVFYFI